MRILLVQSEFRSPLGGAELYTLRLARSLVERGHDVAAATGFAGSDAIEQLDGIDTFLMPAWNVYSPGAMRRRPALPSRLLWHGVDVYNPTVVPWIRTTLDRFRPGVVHTHRFQGLSGAVFAAVRGLPHLHTAHDLTLVHPKNTLVRRDFAGRDGLAPARAARARLLGRWLAGSTIHFPSERALDTHVLLGWRAPKVRSVVLPLGWPEGRLRTVPPNGRSLLRVLFLGRLSDTKGIPLLLDAWGADGVPDAELWIAGDGPLRDRVQRAVQRCSSIRYVGWVEGEAKQRLLDEASVLAFPSQTTEMAPLVCMEGFRSGLPVLASDIAAPSALRDGYNGLIVRGAAPTWRQVIEGLVANRDQVSAMAEGAAGTANDLDWDTHVDRVEALYEEIAA